MSSGIKGKLFSFRSRRNLRSPSETQINFIPAFEPIKEPTVNYNSASEFDNSLHDRNVFMQTTEKYEEQQRRADEQRRCAEEERRRNEDLRRRAEEQKRRNEIAKLEAIQRNRQREREALRQKEAEQIRLAEQAEAEKKEIERRQNASANSIRRLRELIRQKYSLDVYVWSKRKVQKANRQLIVEKYTESDKILQEIYFIVNAWDEDLFDEEEWRVAKKIKASFDEKPQYPLWADVPPWDPRREGKMVQPQP